MNLVQKRKLLWARINLSLKMFLSLSQEKVLQIQSQCQDIHTKGQVTVHELTELLGFLASTIEVVLPVQMNFCIFSKIE